MKFILAASLATLVGGCAVDPKSIAGATLGANTVLGFYTTGADLRQQLAQDTIKESAQLEYLTGFARTCRDNPGYMFPKNYRSSRNIKADTIDKFEKTDRDYIFLLEYSKAFDKIVKQAGDVENDIQSAVAIAKGVGKYSPETAIMSDIAGLLGAAAVAANEEVKFLKIRAAARKYQPLLEEHVKTLSGRLAGLDRSTMRDISIWRDCVQEKFNVIATLAKPSQLPTSAVELDTAYGAFQAQYRSYVGAAPQVGEMLANLTNANKAISTAQNPTQLRESLDRYIIIFDSSRASISKAGALPI